MVVEELTPCFDAIFNLSGANIGRNGGGCMSKMHADRLFFSH